jgi:hypothetical protein
MFKQMLKKVSRYLRPTPTTSQVVYDFFGLDDHLTGLESFGYHVSTCSTGSADLFGTPDDHLTGLESFGYHVSTGSTGSADLFGTPDDHLTGLESFGYHVSTGAPN